MTPSLLAKLGYDSHVIMRVGTTHSQLLEEQEDLEFIWKGHDVDENMDQYELFTHALQRNRYGPPYEIMFDIDVSRFSPKEISCNKKALLGEKRDECLRLFYENWVVPGISRHDKNGAKHVALTFGDDFTFRKARKNFDYIDLLLHLLERHSIRLFGTQIVPFYSSF